MRKQHDFWVDNCFGLQINWQSFWTNRAISRKRKKSHNLAFIILSNGFSVLVDKWKVSYGGIYWYIVLYCPLIQDLRQPDCIWEGFIRVWEQHKTSIV
jgi:hypothetical protein